MKVIRIHRLLAGRFDAINVFGILLISMEARMTKSLLNHECIHTAQMVETGFLLFYLWYVVEWLVRLPMKGRAYENISFEREAYANMHDMEYIRNRKRWAFICFLSRRKATLS